MNFICTFCLGQCDDESCKHTTRIPNFRLLGDRERGTVCPNYPNCNGTLLRKVYALIHLVRSLIFLLLHRTAFNSKQLLTPSLALLQYTEADLYKQLSYFCHILDTQCNLEKVSTLQSYLLLKFYHNQFVLSRFLIIISLVFKKKADGCWCQNSSRESIDEDKTCGSGSSIHGSKYPRPVCVRMAATHRHSHLIVIM